MRERSYVWQAPPPDCGPGRRGFGGQLWAEVGVRQARGEVQTEIVLSRRSAGTRPAVGIPRGGTAPWELSMMEKTYRNTWLMLIDNDFMGAVNLINTWLGVIRNDKQWLIGA